MSTIWQPMFGELRAAVAPVEPSRMAVYLREPFGGTFQFEAATGAVAQETADVVDLAAPLLRGPQALSFVTIGPAADDLLLCAGPTPADSTHAWLVLPFGSGAGSSVDAVVAVAAL